MPSADRGRRGGQEYGTGFSPNAKRPAVMVVPDLQAMDAQVVAMTVEQLTTAVGNLDRRMTAQQA